MVKSHNHNAVIVEAVRTPIGSFMKGLSGVRPDDLLAITIREIIERTGVDPKDIEDVYMGCANQAGEDNRNVARMSALLAGLPYSVPGVTVNRLCASGLEAVNQVSRAIAVGDGDLFIAGGVESMSRAPYSIARGNVAPKAGNHTAWDTCLGWRYPNKKLEEMFPLEAMGCTAENLVDQYDISREEQDNFALESHHKAIAAQDAGWFDDEIVPVSIPQRRGDPVVISQDEGPRRGSSLDKLAKLRAAFRTGGSVTAGNSSTLNDGACALLIASEERAIELDLPIRARIVSRASAGVDPTIMGIGPVPATELALKRAGLSIGDMDAIELNEAFSAQSIAVIKSLGLDRTKVNMHGGAIALGHPLGCSGARILTTLLSVLERTGGRYGLATLCVGVGQGVATIIERVES
jgi:3-oxoadipyl-CoA thiolase